MRAATTIGTANADTPAPDLQRVEEFTGQVVSDLASTMTALFCSLGDRLGLFRALGRGAATSEELAARAGVEERYVREWASGLLTAGYLRRDTASGRFLLPPEHAAVLADEAGPAFLGGAHQLIGDLVRMLAPLERAFRQGGGIALDAYGEDFWQGLQRLTGVDYEHKLVPEWIPAVGDLEPRLRQGARIADVGCGTGVAPIKLARAFPHVRVHGFDVHEPNIARAQEAARVARVGERVSFERLDAVESIPGNYDLITLFNVVHDSRDPLRLMRNARAALGANGTCLILEIKCHEHIEANHAPIGTLLYGLSLFHCMTQSLAEGGAALGTCGLPEPKLRRLCQQAGFRSLTPVAEEPLIVLYVARP